MGYAERVLQPEEHILHRSYIHWLIYFPGLLWLLAAAAIFASEAVIQLFDWLNYVAAVFALIGLVRLLGAAIRRASTEIAVTNKRLIYKVGIFRRSTIEMNLHQVESIEVNQSVFGRLFDYGTVIVRGTGSGIEPIRRVGAPLELRSAVTAQ